MCGLYAPGGFCTTEVALCVTADRLRTIKIVNTERTHVYTARHRAQSTEEYHSVYLIAAAGIAGATFAVTLLFAADGATFAVALLVAAGLRVAFPAFVGFAPGLAFAAAEGCFFSSWMILKISTHCRARSARTAVRSILCEALRR